MGSDQPESTFEDLLAAPDEQFDHEGMMLSEVLRGIESEVRAVIAARAGTRPEVLIVGQILAERWYSAHDDGAECTEMAERVIAGLERAGLLPEASGDRSSASAGGRTAPPEGDALSGVVDDVSERVYRQWQTTPDRDAYMAAVVRQACQEVVEAGRPLIESGALRAYADRHHPSAQGVSYPTDYGTGIEYDTVCTGCGVSWWEDEGGCTERAQILADAEQIGVRS